MKGSAYFPEVKFFSELRISIPQHPGHFILIHHILKVDDVGIFAHIIQDRLIFKYKDRPKTESDSFFNVVPFFHDFNGEMIFYGVIWPDRSARFFIVPTSYQQFSLFDQWIMI